MNTAAARLPGVVFALLGIATTGWLAGVLFKGQGAGGRGQVAAVCYATMVLPFLLAQAPVHDIALVPFTNLALGCVWRGRDPGSGIRDPLLAGLALGLSRALSWRLVMRGVLVVAVAALVALPWYLAMNAREPGYLRYYFIDRHLLGFATDTQRHSGQPWWFYVPVLIGGGLPWLLFVRRPAGAAAPHTLLWTWLGGAVVLLSLSQSKAVTYLLPAMPAIAIMAAASFHSTRTWRTVSIATAATYAAALILFGPAVARAHSARDLAAHFNDSGRLPATIFVFDQRVSFVYYLRPELRRQLRPDQIRSVSVEELAAMQPFPQDAAVTLPIDLAAPRLPRIPALANAQRQVAGRYLVVRP
jgi:4-amino-4-deoxy-L-arabinose transferase-like glycosyltransferase